MFDAHHVSWTLFCLATLLACSAPQDTVEDEENPCNPCEQTDTTPPGEASPAPLEATLLLTLQVPNASQQAVLELEDEEGEQVGSLYFIGLEDLTASVDDLTRDGDTLAFSVLFPGSPEAGRVSMTFELDEDLTGTGTFEQGGLEFPLVVGAMPNRPQTPAPPFPYTVEEVVVTNPDDGAVLAGTLTLPEGEGPHPALLLITGSGAQDRDETVFFHKPFLVIADHLTRDGIAVLRLDDRGVGGSADAEPTVGLEVLAGDARAALDLLAAHASIDAARIGMLGHSYGGPVAALAAAGRDDVAFIISMAGVGVPGGTLIGSQIEDMYIKRGVPEDVAAEIRQHQEAFLALMIDDDATEEALAEGARALVDAITDAEVEHLGETYDEATREALVQQALGMVEVPIVISYLETDPADAFKEITAPVLAINGSLDTQVLHALHLPAIEAALLEGGNEDVTVQVFEGLNHLFQPAETGLLEEYAEIETTMDQAVLDLFSSWLRAQAGLD